MNNLKGARKGELELLEQADDYLDLYTGTLEAYNSDLSDFLETIEVSYDYD